MSTWPPDEPTDSQLLTSPGSIPRINFQPRLVQLSGGRGEVGRVLLLDRDQVVIGRASGGVQLLVNDQGVSRRHAAVERHADGFRVVDFESRNGTFVNNVRVKTAELRDGDRIQLGGATLLRFTSAGTDDEWLHQSLDHGSVALWDYALGSREVTWSEHADRALHLPAGTLANRRMLFSSMLHADDEAQVTAALLLTINAHQPFEQEFRLVVGPEFSRWVLCRAHLLRNGAGQPERITGTVIDVSDRRRRELDLRRMALMFESLSDGVFLIDGAGAVVDLNSGAQRLFGVTKPRALGARLFELLGVPNAGELEVQSQRTFTAEGRWSMDLCLPGVGGDRSFEVVAFPLRNDAGALGAAFLFRDMTERQRLQNQVAFYDRLAALGTLSAGIAHEINNPLSFVLASIEFVLTELSERKEGAFHLELEALGDALEGARRIAHTVRDMKSFSRDDASPQPVPTDARAPLELAFKMTQKLTSSRAVVIRELEEGLPLVLATESRLSQVFINLLVNAAQAIPDEKRGHITVRQRLEGDFVLTEVADDGVGIPREQLTRIFDPFFTTKPVGVGTGLGLSICHSLVTGFGGALSVRSELGKGTTFTVKLGVSREVPRTPSAIRRAEQRRGRILLIDDEPLVLRALSRTLGAVHDVATARSADEAMALLEGEDFDVILCDLMMPGRSGSDFYEQLTKDHPELVTRVVFVSGGAFTDWAREFLARVPNAALTKPVDGVELANFVQARLRDRTGGGGVPLHEQT
ncbi:MAG: ATP-binding protein [Archangium sp.]|nr:ATP-binding protein [Archangium sp.]MDP3571894.1 ATP-binding protein [Archangium sp.]